jgi:8-oxo-dGTP pyrophosphatase MutT (NUDIX family)
MVGSSILPVAIYNRNLYFLFGKENPLEDSAKGFSDFGGGVEGNETPFNTAMREGGEELTGFLGDEKDIRKWVSKRGFYPILVDTYHIHIVPMDYDEKLPVYYNNNHRFLWERMDRNILNKTKLFEKIEIQWFRPSDMRKRKAEFRPFYKKMVDQILSEIPKIRSFINKKPNKRTTMKNK